MRLESSSGHFQALIILEAEFELLKNLIENVNSNIP